MALLLPNLAGGGAERVALASIRDLLKRGAAVDLLLVEAAGELLSLVPQEVNVVDFAAPRLRHALMPLVRYLRRERPDALHAVMWPLTTIAIAAHRIARSSALLMVSEQVALSQISKSGGERALLKASLRLLYPLADVRVACAGGAAEDLIRLSGLAENNFEIIYNPIELPAKVASTAEVEALWGDASVRIITVGSLKEQKNQALLLRSFAQLHRYPGAKLMILGEGQLRPSLESLARSLRISDRVIMPGFSLDPWPYLASADLFVLSSDYEGFPLVLAEAMYAGLPVVSTDCVSGPAEITDNGRFGRLVPCGDPAALVSAMEEALADKPDPERMRRRALELAGPAMVSRYSELLLGDHGKCRDRSSRTGALSVATR